MIKSHYRGNDIECIKDIWIYSDTKEAFTGLKAIKQIEPNKELQSSYQDAYNKWKDVLTSML